MPPKIDTTSNSEIIVTKLKLLRASRRTTDGMTGLPNSPSMAATSAKIDSPPPIAIERLLRSNQHDVRKFSPLSANINRGTFYSHYDDIYGVVEDYENELIEKFFDNARLLASDNFEQFLNSFFDYIKENDENYKMICRSDDFIFTANKLVILAENKLLELCNRNPNLKNREFIATEINVFIEGLIYEYIKYCRGMSSITPEYMYAYTKEWHRRFTEYHL